MSTQELTLVGRAEVAASVRDFMPLLDIQMAVERKTQMNQFIGRILNEGTDYGTIPGTNDKKVLLKPGAEKLCSFFGFSSEFIIGECIEDWTGADHNKEPFFYYRYKCRLLKGGRVLGEGDGSCNSWESKYRWRNSARKCPECGQEAIIVGKKEYGGGFVCFKKKNGCGAKFGDKDTAITGQDVGRVPNPDIADAVNTIQKMAQKRALIQATLIVTNASDAFTQDIEDFQEEPAPTETHEELVERRVVEVKKQDEPLPGPPPDILEPTSPALKELIDKFRGAGRYDRLEMFGEQKKALCALIGEESGEMTYYDILKANGVEHANLFKSLKPAQSCIAELFRAVVALEPPIDSGPLPQSVPFAATDDDIPAIIGGAR